MPEGRRELEYGETTGLIGTLTDVRFKLLAFVPTIAGTAVALLGRHARPAELLAVGTLGLAATVGVVRYEMHNTELYEYALARAAHSNASSASRSTGVGRRTAATGRSPPCMPPCSERGAISSRGARSPPAPSTTRSSSA